MDLGCSSMMIWGKDLSGVRPVPSALGKHRAISLSVEVDTVGQNVRESVGQVDGAPAARFLDHVCEVIEDPSLLFLTKR